MDRIFFPLEEWEISSITENLSALLKVYCKPMEEPKIFSLLIWHIIIVTLLLVTELEWVTSKKLLLSFIIYYLKNYQALIFALESRYTKRNNVIETTAYWGGNYDLKDLECKIQSILLL